MNNGENFESRDASENPSESNVTILEEMGNFDQEKALYEKELTKPFNAVTEEQIGRELTAEEKALKKGIVRDQDGEWRKVYFISERSGQIYEDGFGESASAFELDLKNPELVQKIEELSKKYKLSSFNNHYGYCDLRGLILNNYDELCDSSDEKWDMVINILANTKSRHGNYEERVLKKDDESLSSTLNNISKVYSQVNMNDPRSRKFADEIASELARCYNGNDEEFVTSIVNRMKYAINTEDKRSDYGYYESDSGEGYFKVTVEGIEELCENNCVEQFSKYFDFVDKISTECYPLGDSDMAKNDVFMHYMSSQHGMSSTLIEGLEKNVFPLMEENDPEVASIRQTNSWACRIGNYGIADYTVETLTVKNNPFNLNKMMRIHNELPTADFSRFEQNRIDAARLQCSIIGGRDFIHDEELGVNGILTAMLQYYESEGNEESRKNLEETIARYPNYRLEDYPYNLEKYESIIAGWQKNNYSNAEIYQQDEKAVDILRRLVENTKPVHLQAPKTKYESLNSGLQKINPLINERTGEVRVDISEISDAVIEMNKVLIDTQGNIGIMPSTVEAVCYIDKMSAYAMRSLKSKDLNKIAYDPTFKEILRFSQLSSSTKYDEPDFESFYREFLNQCNAAFDEDRVNEEQIRDAYRLISQRITNNSTELAKKYSDDKRTERFSGAIWSGNLSHELIGLFEI